MNSTSLSCWGLVIPSSIGSWMPSVFADLGLSFRLIRAHAQRGKARKHAGASKKSELRHLRNLPVDKKWIRVQPFLNDKPGRRI
jgi:hypothetical protein